VCFGTWKQARRDCQGNFFNKFVCRAEAFDDFAKCWFKECIISTETCESRPFPDIDDDDDDDIIIG